MKKSNERIDEKVDILENKILDLSEVLLSILLKDQSSGKNILWCTDNYTRYGQNYASNQQMKIELITAYKGNIIKPRTKKGLREKKMRARDKGEVFTPSWVCNAQNNLIDSAWLKEDNCFNKENGKTWIINKNPIPFVQSGRTWQEYVLDKRLEISCGEAPYLVSRYDTVTGEIIEPIKRIGLLDRKIRVVNENVPDNEWVEWVIKAFQSIYGYEWQGDSLLISRENLLYTFRDYYFEKFKEQPSLELQIKIAEIISWNIWQMDGLKGVIPNTCNHYKIIKYTLFGDEVQEKYCDGCQHNDIKKHNGIYCVLKDWDVLAEHEKPTFRFIDLLKQGGVK